VSSLAAILLLLLVPTQQQPHDKAYWKGISAAKFEVPAGETARGLAAELAANLGSADPELRDDLSFTILSSWIYDKKFLGPDDLRPLARTLEGHLRQGIEAPGTDDVLLRSFSALTLSTIAARDNVTPFSTAEEYGHLLDSALTYFRDERDTRRFDTQKGWIHTAAHTSDLLKFLARNPRLAIADQARILSALLAKNRDAAAAYSQGEDERMARAAISILRRTDFDRDGFKTWLSAAQSAATFPNPPAVATLRAQQNVRHLLSSLWIELSSDERPSEGADFARAALRETIRKLF